MRLPMLKLSIPALALSGFAVFAPLDAGAAVSIGISVNMAPPPLPVYVQPPCPAPGYIWTPGYWAWDEGDYYWVPGTWIEPPQVGFLWTPGYWGWSDGVYLWHAGYWGPHVGFYGGVDYGYGYTGRGFEGGYWRDRTFFYNRAVANVRTTNITNVYNKTVINHVTVNRVSFNGGSGGISARPSATEERAAHDRHVAFTNAQEHHEHAAAGDRALRDSVNHGRPSIAATQRPGAFNGPDVVAARGGVRHETAERGRPALQPHEAPHAMTRVQPRETPHETPHAMAHDQPREMQRGAMPQDQHQPRGESARAQPHETPRPQARNEGRGPAHDAEHGEGHARGGSRPNEHNDDRH